MFNVSKRLFYSPFFGGSMMVSQTVHRVWASVVALVLVGIPVASAATSQISEDFGDDPGWTGANNTAKGNNFGFSEFTNNAGGAVGELGGVIVERSNAFDYYADTALGGTLSQQDVLSASGRFNVVDRPLDGAFDIGWFDTTPSALFSVGPLEAVTLRFNDFSSTQYRVNNRWGVERSDTSESSALLDMGTEYLFTLDYDPNGGGVGLGRAFFTIRLAADNSLITSLDTGTGGDASSGGTPWEMNAFGMLTINTGTISGSAEAYFDNLEYTAVPEPASLMLMGLGTVITLMRRRKA